MSKAESAPLAPQLPSSSSAAATAAPLASRASVLLVAAAVAASAPDCLRAVSGADVSVEALAAAVRLARLLRRLGALLQVRRRRQEFIGQLRPRARDHRACGSLLLACCKKRTILADGSVFCVQDPDQHLFAEAGGAPVTPLGELVRDLAD